MSLFKKRKAFDEEEYVEAAEDERDEDEIDEQDPER